MYPYDEYKFSHPRGRLHFRGTQLLGLLPLSIVLVMIGIRGLASGPGLWCALGCTVALEMTLWSAQAVLDEPVNRGKLGAWFAARADTVTPPLFVVVRGAFVAITLCLLWYSFCEMGYPATMLQHTLFVLILVVPPVRRLLKVDEPFSHRPRVVLADQLLLHTHVILVTLLVTVGLQYLVFPKDHAYITEVPLPAVIIWVPGILVCAGSAVLFLEFLRKRRAEAARVQRVGQTLQRQGPP